MQYMALIYSAPEAEPVPGTDEFGAYVGEFMKVSEEFRNEGAMVSGDGLQGVETATTVRVRDGKITTTDGPFAETKETLGGYYLFECDNLDEAIKLASRIPTARHGSIEVRPVQVFN